MSARDILVYVFLRGGCDALNFIPPASGDDRKTYEEERPNINISSSTLLKLDPHFGLHPSASEIHNLYENKKLAIVHAAGIPVNNRSHFDAQNIVELGLAEKKIMPTGWLTRHLEFGGDGGSGSLPAISCGGLPPTSLLGNAQAIVMNEPAKLNLGGQKPMVEGIETALRSMYGLNEGNWVSAAGTRALKSLALIEGKDPHDYNPRGGIEYPKGELGNRLKILAQLLTMNLGLRVATVDMGGWDTHKNQGVNTEGTFAKQVEQLSKGLDAFYKDTTGGKLAVPAVTIIVMSEFGRRLRENANRGTDHGHGGFMMVLGDHVNGGKVYGRWPGIKTDQLYERADLAVTTDYRTVISEVLIKRTGNKNISNVFPNFKTPQYLGIVSET
jgi:uncharacterized protein (DUF1501 family)